MAKSVSHPISTLDQYQILESRVDMGCDTDFAMYYSLFITGKGTHQQVNITGKGTHQQVNGTGKRTRQQVNVPDRGTRQQVNVTGKELTNR